MFFLLSVMLLSACTGLAGEPRIVSTLIPRPTEVPLTLDTATLDREQGAAIFAERCADCHGINGEGGTQVLNGQTLENMPNFTDPATVADHTLEDYYNIITNGLLDEGKLMPGFASLSDDERAAVAYYVYSLNEFAPETDNNAVPAPISTEEAAATSEAETTPDALPETDLTATVSGQIQHSRPDVTLPDELQVSLILVNIATFEQTLINNTANADGTFQFDAVPLSTQFAYLVRVLYEDRIFSSVPVRGNDTTPVFDIPVTVYDTTDDTTAITGQFISMRILPGTGTLQGLQVMGFTNTSPDVFMTENQLDDETFASLTLPLPFRNVLVDMPDTEGRFIPTEDGLSVYDTQPVFPGAEYITQLPFEFPHNNRTTIDFVMDYALSGTFEIFVAKPLSIEHPDMTIAETFTDEQTGLTFDIYTTPLELAAGERFTYTI
ncbi:MAG: c-type cytochrome, partial [Aggregatilineales bacterium]